jgi:hypothetical protein
MRSSVYVALESVYYAIADAADNRWYAKRAGPL